MQLLWAPPSYAQYVADDRVRFRFLLNHRGWATGLLWSALKRPDAAAKSGITWATNTEVKDVIWSCLSQAAGDGVNASDAYDAIVADTLGAFWSAEFLGAGKQVEGARRYLQRFSRDISWAGHVAVPGRTIDQEIDETFRCFVAYSGSQVQGLHAHRRDALLWREDGRWWRVPREDSTLTWDRLVEVKSSIAEPFDLLGTALLRPRVVQGFAHNPLGSGRR